ncbi:MAG: hypothetical protein WD960_13210 [Gemmatimonadota bacterium]
MSDFNAFVSPEYPVLHSVLPAESSPAEVPEGFAALSLGLLVNGIPSFLATIPVDETEVDDISISLEAGDVRVAVVGMSVDGEEILEEAGASSEPWEAPDPSARSLPAAFLSLVCGDGRKIGVAKIVAREGSASPEEVARFVLKQIARGVQIPDLASAG